jgi:hypothetical protein
MWSGRASQEVFVEPAVGGLASMYPAFDWSVVLRAIKDISARAISLSDRPRPVHMGHQCSHAPGRPNYHLVSFSRRPRPVRLSAIFVKRRAIVLGHVHIGHQDRRPDDQLVNCWSSRRLCSNSSINFASRAEVDESDVPTKSRRHCSSFLSSCFWSDCRSMTVHFPFVRRTARLQRPPAI